MCRKLLITAAIVVGALFVAKRMDLGGYICSGLHDFRQHVRQHIPDEVKFRQVEHEIARIDRDLEKMIPELADLQYRIKLHNQDIRDIETKLASRKGNLNTWIADLKNGTEVIKIEGYNYDRRQINRKVTESFRIYRGLERHFKTKQQLLDADQKQFDAKMEYAERLAAKKQELEVRVASLRAEYAARQATVIRNRPLVTKNQHVRSAERTLQELKSKLEKQRIEDGIRERAPFANSQNRARPQPVERAPDLQEITDHLNGTAVRDQKLQTTVQKD